MSIQAGCHACATWRTGCEADLLLAVDRPNLLGSWSLDQGISPPTGRGDSGPVVAHGRRRASFVFRIRIRDSWRY